MAFSTLNTFNAMMFRYQNMAPSSSSSLTTTYYNTNSVSNPLITYNGFGTQIVSSLNQGSVGISSDGSVAFHNGTCGSTYGILITYNSFASFYFLSTGAINFSYLVITTDGNTLYGHEYNGTTIYTANISAKPTSSTPIAFTSLYSSSALKGIGITNNAANPVLYLAQTTGIGYLAYPYTNALIPINPPSGGFVGDYGIASISCSYNGSVVVVGTGNNMYISYYNSKFTLMTTGGANPPSGGWWYFNLSDSINNIVTIVANFTSGTTFGGWSGLINLTTQTITWTNVTSLITITLFESPAYNGNPMMTVSQSGKVEMLDYYNNTNYSLDNGITFTNQTNAFALYACAAVMSYNGSTSLVGSQSNGGILVTNTGVIDSSANTLTNYTNFARNSYVNRTYSDFPTLTASNVIYCSCNYTGQYVGFCGGSTGSKYFYSTNYGTTFTAIPNMISTVMTYGNNVVTSGQYFFASGSTMVGLSYSTNYGTTWQLTTEGYTWLNLAINYNGSLVFGYRAANTTIYYSTNYGTSWLVLAALSAGYLNTFWSTSMLCNYDGSTLLVLNSQASSTNNGTIYTYNGSTWSSTIFAIKGTSTTTTGGAIGGNGQYMICTTSTNAVYISKNRGISWTLNALSLYIDGLTISGTGQFMCVVNNNGPDGRTANTDMYLSTNYGVSFFVHPNATLNNLGYTNCCMNYDGSYLYASIQYASVGPLVIIR